MSGMPIVPPFARTERDLICAAQAGDAQAVSYLLTKYEPVLRLISSLMRTLDPARRQRDELRGAANLALLEALPKFDLTRGVKFTTYAWYCVRGAMLMVLFPDQRSSLDKPTPPLFSLDAQIDGDADDTARFERDLLGRDPQHGLDPELDRALDADRDAAVRRFVTRLPEGQRGIVVDIFWQDKTHVEIAQQRGVSRPAISRALARSYGHGRRELAAYEQTLAA